MKLRRLFALSVLLAGGILVWHFQHPNEDVSSSAKLAETSVQNGWSDLNQKAEHLDPNSTMKDLEDQRQKIVKQLGDAKDTVTSDYGRAKDGAEKAKAEYDRLTAAENIKKIQKQLDDLKATGKQLSESADSASKTLQGLQEKLGEAKQTYQSAKDKAAQFLPQPPPSP